MPQFSVLSLKNDQLMPQLANSALTIIRERYADFGPTLACEKLRELHGITLAKETVRRLMTEAGFWTPRVQRSAKIYQPRNRRHCVGELIQIDGSDHRWFEERGPACTLLVYIDDATSRLMHLYFTYSESTFSYFEATRAYLELHGKPLAFYSDKATVCCGQSRIDPRADDGLTQAKSLQSQCWQRFARLVHGSAESRHVGQKWIGANIMGN